jgi:hypothetical protein
LDQGVYWAPLDDLLSFGGGNLVVTLSDDANNFVIADAVRIEMLSDPEIAVEVDGQDVLLLPIGVGLNLFDPLPVP